ncbi:unnamed protein product [Microthlaspi erraticum]|uniref:Uncharacterized protein n=1 Tax=Microthlaspi erraticum TaxID=1685480 RepID=A0A6D2KDY0_9BRAS|nr:unnamed protein product [Microthlaspi erraticum]
MDFIKTSSLRALIELTFQRNWNGLIWMSRKGVITKRVKTVQTALSRNSAQPRRNIAPRSAKPPSRHAVTRTTMPREPGNKASRPRNPFAYHGRCIRPSRGRSSHVRPRNLRPNLNPPDHAGRPCNHPATTKRSYNQKSGDCPDGSIEKQSPTTQSGWPRNACSALGQNCVHPSEVSAKSETTRPIMHHDPGNLSPRSASPQPATPQLRTTKARELGSNASRPAERFHWPNIYPPDQAGRP